MSSSRKKCRVFVVHDEPIIASSLALILRHEGFDAKSFTQSLEALRGAICRAPDILISDENMPLLNGIELAIRVRKHRPGCKVLLFSGQANPASLLEYPGAGHHSFELIQKPAHPKDILKRIQMLLHGNPPLPLRPGT